MAIHPLIGHYPAELQAQVQQLIDSHQLGHHLRQRYPTEHGINNDSLLRDYVQQLKDQYLKKSPPLSKVVFDRRMHVVDNALGMHSSVSRVQGGKLKNKREIRISTLFKQCPEPLLQMICVHELAHLREQDHNKAFYRLCQHMLPDYHQLEFDTRLYLLQQEMAGKAIR
ncbi:UTP pyrophosphatase [Sinobacterium norvegicum]|uniref:UTP pyrophosphatase n=1 Tax=Sinobacterium norvegicum TaxID=1641715 RepID=A0ABM9AB63_9GAMM|nr:M48 family metallopeptidase [Sinobacterium norvegicum]CAH0990232.1 UTP pyrophosphatase [Sinobacterium norvegicum]